MEGGLWSAFPHSLMKSLDTLRTSSKDQRSLDHLSTTRDFSPLHCPNIAIKMTQIKALVSVFLLPLHSPDESGSGRLGTSQRQMLHDWIRTNSLLLFITLL